jgi:uncharacterized membrane protein
VLSSAAVNGPGKAVAASISAEALAGARPAVRAVARIHFVDLLRLLGSLQMLHGHSMDAVMAEELRRGAVYDAWSAMRGLVSVAFLLTAGLSYHLSTLARFEQHRANRAKVLYRFRRGAWLVLLGYLLHFPEGILSGDAEIALASLRESAMVDVLQCIGACILTLELLTLFARRSRQVVIASGVLALLAFALAPLGERLDPSGAWRPLVNYVTHQGGSLFPLLPWAGYVFAGVALGEYVLPHGTRTAPEHPTPRLAIAGALVLAIAGLAQLVPITLTDEATSANARPAFTLWKLGFVIAIVLGLALLGRRIRRIPRFLEILAGESLILYVSHLFVLYGVGIGLHRWFGHTLSLWASFAIATAMVFAMSAVGLGWNRFKAWREARAR